MSDTREQKFRIPLSTSSEAVLYCPHPMTEGEYRALARWLAWARESFVADTPRPNAAVGPAEPGEQP